MGEAVDDVRGRPLSVQLDPDMALSAARKVVLERLCSPDIIVPVPDQAIDRSKKATGALAIYEEVEKALATTVQGTLQRGENSSALLVGPAGVGRSRIVRRVLASLRRAADTHAGFQVVELSSLTATDDAGALLDIARQLCAENALHVGHHLSFAQGIRAIFQLIRAATAARQSIIFVLHDFAHFASKGRQTLLYTLLDLLQSPMAQLAVLGIAERIDVIDCLEKRVRSRFSGRVHLLPAITHGVDIAYGLGGLLSLGPDDEVHWAEAYLAEGAALAPHDSAVAFAAFTKGWHEDLAASLDHEAMAKWLEGRADLGCTRAELCAWVRAAP